MFKYIGDALKRVLEFFTTDLPAFVVDTLDMVLEQINFVFFRGLNLVIDYLILPAIEFLNLEEIVSKINNSFGSIPADAYGFINVLRIDDCIAVLLAAVVIRLILNFTPFVG